MCIVHILYSYKQDVFALLQYSTYWNFLTASNKTVSSWNHYIIPDISALFSKLS